jgi:hypothetical protein
MRMFARTNARCTDGLRGVIGVNGSVLEVTAIGAEALRLRSASGREWLVAWDTLRATGSAGACISPTAKR